MMIVVSYDVSTVSPAGRRRLRRIAKACTDYGQRVQNSVFECHLDPTQWTMLKLRLLDICNEEQDSLRFYFLGANWKGAVEHHGRHTSSDPQDPLFA